LFRVPEKVLPRITTLPSSPRISKWSTDLAHRQVELDVETSITVPDLTHRGGYRRLKEKDNNANALLVFIGVPLTLTDGFLSPWLRGIPLSIIVVVGFISLSGIVVLNGMVIISFIDNLRDKGLSLDDAIKQGSLTRLRPVLMTALVAS
jgi:hypothetical protein